MSHTPHIFVSATSGDLGSYRRAVHDVLVTNGALPVDQDHSVPDYLSVVASLRGKISSSDAVICRVGQLYGREPKQRPADQPRTRGAGDRAVRITELNSNLRDEV